jgi:hypothetical protein
MKAIFVFVIFLANISSMAQHLAMDLELGAVFTGYNNIRIPGNAGTEIDVSSQLRQDFTFFLRGRTTFLFGENKHAISILAAPLRIEYSGSAPNNVRFQQSDFPANEPLNVIYRFDSYRLTYRYHFIRKEKLLIGAGLTAKVRDASIRFTSGDVSDVKTDLGVVPLINFNVGWLPLERTRISVDGDALIGPGGRAADIGIFVNQQLYRHLWVKGGYRILEGGADNSRVYNFSLIHYAALGALIFF